MAAPAPDAGGRKINAASAAHAQVSVAIDKVLLSQQRWVTVRLHAIASYRACRASTTHSTFVCRAQPYNRLSDGILMCTVH